MTNALNTSLENLAGVTPHRRDLLARLELATVGDLLFHFPRAYEDLTDVTSIAALTAHVPQTAQGDIVEMDSRYLASGGSVVSIVISDDSKNVLEGVWFNQPRVSNRFHYGQRVSFSGKPKWYKTHWQMANPRVQALEGGVPAAPGVVPIYPLTEDLRPDVLRKLMRAAVDHFSAHVQESIPETLRLKHGWPRAHEAMRDVHFPASLQAANLARQRFTYEALLVLQSALALRRREVRDQERAPILCCTPAIDARIRKLFPFPLTGDQNKAIAEIVHDLNSPRPMQRLVQADVGAGKTAIAIYAMLVAVACGRQAALMAPTEVLARQHARTLDRYLAHSRVRRLLLTGSLSPRERREAHDKLKAGDIDLVVGTQSLVQEGVEFARLGVVVIDEQHKFGVNQRAQVRKMGGNPHYLVMTATPIPRTVALTVFGDLDVSLVRELPPGRQPMTTRWLHEVDRDRVYEMVRQGIRQGRQAYVVCPLVDESDKQDLKSATTAYKELSAGAFRDFRVGLLHGKQDEDVKADVMARFANSEIDVLACTSVVEVGVDVPNATYLIIEHAERFGLSQLHQLRGRVSRGETPGHCFLFAQPPTDDSKERLQVLVRTTDGFALAEEDARLRGAGELFGTRQHGAGELWALAQGGGDLLARARQDAFAIVTADAQLSAPEHASLRAAVIARYGTTLELAEVG